MNSKSEVKRVAAQNPLAVAEAYMAMKDKLEVYRKVIEVGLDMVEQLKSQGCILPAEVDTFEDAAREALNG